MTRPPAKRPAYEPGAGLAEPAVGVPGMRRPASTVAGAVLVLLRAAAGAVWMLSFALGWNETVQSLTLSFSGDADDATDISDDASATILAITMGVVAAGVLIEAALGLLILRGTNWPRVLVMVFSVTSISSSFVAWWWQSQEIRIETTFVTLSLDILILLALSSRSAAAYARRHERRHERR